MSRAELLSGVRVLSNGHIVRRILPLPQSFAYEKRGLARARRIAGALAGSTHSTSTRISRGLFVTDEFSNGFFHWICDDLPRLEAIEAIAPGELSARTLVVPAMAAAPYVAASLSAFRIGGAHCMTRRELVHCEDLLVIPGVAPTGNYRPELMEHLRERFRSRFSPAGGLGRIFISRLNAPRRKIANEHQIRPVLENRGFSALVAESLPFEEQVRHIGAASVLVGNHGAGLTHILWMQPGSCLVELRRRGDRVNNCYFSLASALGIRYFYVLCDATDPRKDAHETDLIVDPCRLDEVIAEACAVAGAT